MLIQSADILLVYYGWNKNCVNQIITQTNIFTELNILKYTLCFFFYFALYTFVTHPKSSLFETRRKLTKLGYRGHYLSSSHSIFVDIAPYSSGAKHSCFAFRRSRHSGFLCGPIFPCPGSGKVHTLVSYLGDAEMPALTSASLVYRVPLSCSIPGTWWWMLILSWSIQPRIVLYCVFRSAVKSCIAGQMWSSGTAGMDWKLGRLDAQITE